MGEINTETIKEYISNVKINIRKIGLYFMLGFMKENCLYQC